MTMTMMCYCWCVRLCGCGGRLGSSSRLLFLTLGLLLGSWPTCPLFLTLGLLLCPTTNGPGGRSDPSRSRWGWMRLRRSRTLLHRSKDYLSFSTPGTITPDVVPVLVSPPIVVRGVYDVAQQRLQQPACHGALGRHDLPRSLRIFSQCNLGLPNWYDAVRVSASVR